MDSMDEGTGGGINQAPDPGTSSSGGCDNVLPNNNKEDDTLSLPPPPPRPYKINNNNNNNSNKGSGRSNSTRSVITSTSNNNNNIINNNNNSATTPSKSKSSHSWLETFADIRDNLLAADTVSIDGGSRHGSRHGNVVAPAAAASPRVVFADSPSSFRLSPTSFQLSSSMNNTATTEGELTAEWRNKYHHLAHVNAEVEADLLSQLSALSNALFEKTREHNMLKKSSEKTVASLRMQVETQQVTLDARVKDLESIQIVVEGQKNTVGRLQRQLGTLVADNNFTLEDTTRVEIDRLQAKERENYARLVAFERENKSLMKKVENQNMKNLDILEELDGYKTTLKELHQCHRELEDTKQKLVKVTALHSTDKSLLREEQQKYEDSIRQRSQQRIDFSQKEEQYRQQISALSSNKAQLESEWMTKCEEIQQESFQKIEDMKDHIETKCEELFIAKEIAAELQEKVSTLTAQFEASNAESDKQLKICVDQYKQLLKEERVNVSKVTAATIADLQGAIQILEEECDKLRDEKDEKLDESESKIMHLEEKVKSLERVSSKLWEEKELQISELQHNAKILEQEVIKHMTLEETANDTIKEQMNAAQDLVNELDQNVSSLTLEISSLTMEHNERIQAYEEEKDRLLIEFEEARSANNDIKDTLEQDLEHSKNRIGLATAAITDLEEEIQGLKLCHDQLREEKESHILALTEHIQLLKQEVIQHKSLVQEAHDAKREYFMKAEDNLISELEQKVSSLTLNISSLTLDHEECIQTYKQEITKLEQMLEETKYAKDEMIQILQQDLEQKLSDARDRIKELNADIQNMKMDHKMVTNDKESEVSAGRLRASELENQISTLESLLADAESSSNEELAIAKENASILEEKVAFLAQELESSESNVGAYYKQEVEKYEHMVEQTKNSYTEVIESLKQNIETKNETLAVATQQIMELEAGILDIQLQYDKMKDEKASEVFATEQRAIALEQDVIRYKSVVKEVQEKFESRLVEANEMAEVRISELQNEKSHAAAMLEEKQSYISRVETNVATLHQEINELRAKLENESVNEEMISSLRFELNEAKDGFDLDLMKYRKESEEHQHALQSFYSFYDQEKANYTAALEKKNEALSAAEKKVIELSQTISLMSDEIDQLQIETGKLIACSENPVEQLQRDRSLEDLQVKLLDRDQTINGLLKAAAAQDEKLAAIETEKENLMMERLSIHEITAREEEINKLKTILDCSRKIESSLEIELQRLRDEISSFKESGQSIADMQTKLDEVHSSVEKLEKEKAGLEDALKEIKVCAEEKVLDLESKLQVKEAVIETLKKTSIDYEQQLTSFRRDMDSPEKITSLESFQKLQDESEMFACQIIEQEEELDQLKSKLEEENHRNYVLKNDMQKLYAKLEELESNNKSHWQDNEKLQTMRNVGDGEEMHLNALETQIEDLEISLASLHRENALLRDQNKQHVEAKFQRDVSSVVHGTNDSEKQKLLEHLAEKESAITDFTERIKTKNSKITELEQELQRMRQIPSDFEGSVIVSAGEYELSGNKNNIEREIAEIAHKNQIVKKQASQIAVLTSKLEESENGRLTFEKTNFESFEKKLALIKLNKDSALDSFRKEVASLKASKKEIEIDFMNQITALESTRNGSRSEVERKMKAKDEAISRLEQKVVLQEQLFNNMRLQMEQLRGSMSQVNLSRRDEVDEMQQELMDSSAKLKQNEREIAALKMKLDEEKLQHADDMSKLRSQLATRGVESATAKGAREIREEMEATELNETIQQLRRRNTTLSEENSKLCAKFESLETGKKSSGNTDKWRTSALKDQVKTLMLRVQELEGRHKELRSSRLGAGSP